MRLLLFTTTSSSGDGPHKLSIDPSIDNFDHHFRMTIITTDKSVVQLSERPSFARFANANTSEGDNADLLVSTYQLEPQHIASSTRSGSLFVLSMKQSTSDDDDDSNSQEDDEPKKEEPKLSVQRRIPTKGGIFRFENVPDSTKVICALTTGCLAIIDPLNDQHQPQQSTSQPLSTTDNVMILNASYATEMTNKVLCSNTQGELCIVDVGSGDYQVEQKWRAHHLPYASSEDQTTCEVWSCCWLDHPQMIASGAEDAVLKLWDLRESVKRMGPLRENKRTHSSGIIFTGMDGTGSLLLTGSYDEHLRAFDLRNITKPLKEVKLNGGVWTVEQMADGKHLLAACMYGGWCVVNAHTFDIIYAEKELGDNLLYGASSHPLLPCEGDFLLGLCTFNNSEVLMHKLSIGDGGGDKGEGEGDE